MVCLPTVCCICLCFMSLHWRVYSTLQRVTQTYAVYYKLLSSWLPEVAQWRAERILSPAKRGRKPGSGKKNVVKAVTGKEVYVTVDLSKYEPGTVLLQNGFCRAFPGMPRCMECGTCEGDLPSNRYCRFLEFRK